MKPYLIHQLEAAASPLTARSLVREYLQARILGALQGSGALAPLAFHGGTALRFLYAIPRYSEDLDFTLECPGPAYDFRAYLQAIQRAFTAEGYAVAIKLNDQKIVHSAFIRFPGLLHELGLSPHADEALAIKLEVDTRPPAGAGLATTVIRRHVTLQLHHHDRASLLAGKLHAVLQREYVKGRDVYDLLWYLSDPTWPPPNLTLLNNALRQTAWAASSLTADTWRAAVRARVLTFDWARVTADVAPFLEDATAATLLTRENLLRVGGPAA